jgi:hypothetical protein
VLTIQAYCKKKLSKKKDLCIEYSVDSDAFPCLLVPGLYIIGKFFL